VHLRHLLVFLLLLLLLLLTGMLQRGFVPL
jgi:hypothetical protein